MIEEIKLAAELSNRCQRNWDHSATIPDDHVETLLHCIQHAPTKHNETHYKVFFIRDPKLIYKIYKKTKHFSLTPQDGTQYTDDDGRTIDDYNIENPQVNANLLIAFCDDWKQEHARALVHRIVEERKESSLIAHNERDQQRFISIGIAVGEVILTANLLGYRTGLCSAFSEEDMKEFFNGECVRLLVGIGLPDPTKNRREHEELYNRDVAAESERTGALDEKWIFPTYQKQVSIMELNCKQ